jgi:hypothetical protein
LPERGLSIVLPAACLLRLLSGLELHIQFASCLFFSFLCFCSRSVSVASTLSLQLVCVSVWFRSFPPASASSGSLFLSAAGALAGAVRLSLGASVCAFPFTSAALCFAFPSVRPSFVAFSFAATQFLSFLPFLMLCLCFCLCSSAASDCFCLRLLFYYASAFLPSALMASAFSLCSAGDDSSEAFRGSA